MKSKRQKLTPRHCLRNSHWRQFSSVKRHVEDSGPKLKLVNTFTASFLANLAGPFVDPYLFFANADVCFRKRGADGTGTGHGLT